MGAALQQQPNSAKDAAITSKQQTTNLMADQRNDSSALNLQTGTTSVATRDKSETRFLFYRFACVLFFLGFLLFFFLIILCYDCQLLILLSLSFNESILFF